MNDTAIVTVSSIPAERRTMAAIGRVADSVAVNLLLADYRARKSPETLRRQAGDVALFQQYLALAGVLVSDLIDNLEAWSGVTYGLVDGFNRWQLQQGYAIGSINVRLATVKAYCALALKHGSLDSSAYTLIQTVKGYRKTEGRNVDERRIQTRHARGKKASPVSISKTHADMLKQQPDTSSKGRRDALLMCLLLELGLRCGEISDLDRSSFDLARGELVFYRHKVDITQTHTLTPDTWRAAKAYLEQLLPEDQDAPLFAGPCSKGRMCERTINARVAALGKRIGLAPLSPHDCRHYWATVAVRNGTDIKSLQDAGGWSSPSMPLRYAESSKIANAGVKLQS